MKTIYTLTLDDDEVPLSSRVMDDIKVICSLVYEDISSNEDKKGKSVVLTEGIKQNVLLESRSLDGYKHHFNYSDISTGIYEPFMIKDDSFSFTVRDNMIDDKEILKSLEEAEKILGVNYKFKIDMITYEDDKNNKNRLIAIKKICNLLKDKKEKKNNFVKVLKPIMSIAHLF